MQKLINELQAKWPSSIYAVPILIGIQLILIAWSIVSHQSVGWLMVYSNQLILMFMIYDYKQSKN
jgi:hypothetical protein